MALSNPYGPKAIYGEDNRVDPFDAVSELHVKLTESVVAKVHKNRIISEGKNIELQGIPFSDYTPLGPQFPMCQKEKFLQQPLVSDCSGVLVADDIIATAGHCMLTAKDCTNYRWIFNVKVSKKRLSNVYVVREDIYTCTEVLHQVYEGNYDVALVRLDRPRKGRAVRIASTEPEKGTPLVMIGHPLGLPQKISSGAQVISHYPGGFAANLDSLQGNSGSGVFNDRTGELVGTLAFGNPDLKKNETLACTELRVFEPLRGGEGVSSYTQFSTQLREFRK